MKDPFIFLVFWYFFFRFSPKTKPNRASRANRAFQSMLRSYVPIRGISKLLEYDSGSFLFDEIKPFAVDMICVIKRAKGKEEIFLKVAQFRFQKT